MSEVDGPQDAAPAADEVATVVDPRRLHEAARIAEALVFASAGPVPEGYIADRLPAGVDVGHVMRQLRALYAGRGVNLVQVADHWAFRTAPDLSFVVRSDEGEVRKLSRAALEVLSIIAYHQPVTRAEIEDIRGVQTSKGTLDVLLEAGWVRFRGRRRTPGRPVTFGTTKDFLDHFGLEELRDLPGLEELKGAGLLSGRIPSNFQIPLPLGEDELADDEDPITQMDLEELGLLTPGGKEDE
ncbi:segregation and condensation protein B [Rhizobium azooxidifex]|uniref:Segregation and condensation protein B n=1 Tax=Mycoplana azooxidifex TaxID=1636188 RepID=A0A7W6GK06_9HYPH|nr:SMC-Scp complex subunit ScpB [Mycoplana azooxidifex]MBB3977822.1 segregation and condensation protein B [Mycoplana azooxidifex]